MSNKYDVSFNPDLLEKYLIGLTSDSETKMIENLIQSNPEVSEVYNKMQNQLELVCQVSAEETPEQDLLNNILNGLENDTNDHTIDHHTKAPITLTSVNQEVMLKKRWLNFTIAASISTLIFAGTAFKLYLENQKLFDENRIILQEISNLKTDFTKNQATVSLLKSQLDQLNNPETEKYVLKGNRRAKNLKTVVYINAEEQTSKLDVVSLPTLKKEQCYQIWADIQGKMVSLGILSEADKGLQNIPYTKDALGLSITIEPKGGSTETSSETPVAEISLKQLND